MQIRITSSDGPGQPNVIESAIDDVAVTRIGACTTQFSSPGAITGPLRVARQGGNLQLSWDPDCGSGTRFGVYRGDLSTGLSSMAPVAGLCDVTALSAELPLDSGSYLFLVAPNDSVAEGSLGLASGDVPRAQPASVCYPRASPVNACAP